MALSSDPMRCRSSIELPACGMFIGTGIYPTSGEYLLSTLYAHQTWIAEDNTPRQMIDRILADNQGNLAQLWGVSRGYAARTHAQWFYALDEIGVEVPAPNWDTLEHVRVQDCEAIKQHADRQGAGVLRFIEQAAAKGLYTVLIYADAKPQWARQFQNVGPYYLGYDFGERFTFRFDEAALRGRPPASVTLETLADDLIQRVREHIEERRRDGWGPIMATSLNFYIDYEVVAGVDIPVLEDFAFSHINMASALSRGLYRQFDLPLWGSHLAHEHYSWLPYAHPHKFDLLRAALNLKYMAGCKMVINESGNWHVEGSLCEDSPQQAMPRVPLPPGATGWNGDRFTDFSPHIEAARPHLDTLGYDSAVCRQYRQVISEFYDFVKDHGTPAGQPETTVALAKGNYDLCGHRYAPKAPVAGAYTLADQNPAWLEGAPERGWEIAQKVFYPLLPLLDPQPNRFLSGTPLGMVDIVSFAKDLVSAETLAAHYRAVLFTGWNTCSEKQYQTLEAYVAAGGTLFLALPHLSTNVTRNAANFGVDELVRGGDFSTLCGVKVLGRGPRIYWATAPRDSNALGFTYPRRFGIIGASLGALQVTDSAVEVLAVDDERGRPVLLRRSVGLGTVYFLNTWAYPGAVNTDEGPGAVRESAGLVGTIYRHIALRCRGEVFITDDGREPGPECEHVAFSYFPESQAICLYNVDFRRPHALILHDGDEATPHTLAPGEFRMIEAQGGRVRCQASVEAAS